MTFESFIPPRAKNVVEVIGEQSADFQNSKENFMAIQPACKYSVVKNFSEVKGNFDAIILQSALIGNLNHAELIELIKKSAKLLNKRGALIFTLDNIAFAENVLSILKGESARFKITLSVQELNGAIQESGMNIYRVLNASRRISVPKMLVDLSETDVAVFAYIVSATLEELPQRTVIQSVIGERLVCAPIRINLPNDFIMTEPGFFSVSAPSGQPYKLFTDNEEYQNKIFINQRVSVPSFAAGKNFYEKLRDAGYLFLNEMDDNPNLWRKDYERSGWINFVGVHAVQTSTEYLANYLREFNPNVKVFANQLRRIQSPRNYNKEFNQKDRPITIFFGALNRDEDFAEILPVINDIAATYGKKILFKIIGRQELFNSIQSENKILLGKKEVYDYQYVTYEEYEEALHTSDIALLPLKDTEFNRSKSDLKFIECAGAGAVAVASPVAYSNVIKDGENGFIFRDNKELDNKLRTLIFNKKLRREVAENAYNYVKHNRLMSQHYEERIDWYRELLAKLPELNREVELRIEKLAPKFKDEVTEKIIEPPKNISSENKGLLGPNNEIIIPV